MRIEFLWIHSTAKSGLKPDEIHDLRGVLFSPVKRRSGSYEMISIPEFISAHIHNASDDTGAAFKVRIKDARGFIEPFVNAW